MTPASTSKQDRDAWEILGPYCEVYVVVAARDLTRMEIDSPATKKPMLDPLLVKECMHLAYGSQLLLRLLVHNPTTKTGEPLFKIPAVEPDMAEPETLFQDTTFKSIHKRNFERSSHADQRACDCER